MEAYTVFAGILLLGVILYFFVSDPVSFLFFGLLIAILLFVLIRFGFVSASTKPNELDITYRPTPVPTGSPSTVDPEQKEYRSVLQEVFHITDNIFTYDQAEPVCKAYGAELATYSQVEDAYRRGAEWCSYGWTQGGIALFPTQDETWRKLQVEVDPSKRIACGRPGVNGGYFDPTTKFGVNCYGIRPEKKKGTISGDADLARSVARIKGMLDKFTVNPFSKKDWSEYSGASKGIVSAEANIKGLGSEIGKGSKVIGESVGEVSGEIVKGGAAAAGGIVGIVKSLGEGILSGLGGAGQSFYDSLK